MDRGMEQDATENAEQTDATSSSAAVGNVESADAGEQSVHESALLDILQQNWGYFGFHDLQLPAMNAVMDNRDSLVVLPTGGGKSLCYQAPAVAKPGLAVVVSPLISLMKDQVDALRANGVQAAYINSTLSAQERWEVADQMEQNQLSLLYVAPERLDNEGLLTRLGQADLSFFAIDEAHCVSQWGHDFRPHYRELSKLRERFPKVAMHAYTATATERVRDDIAVQLQLQDPEVLIGNFDRPNLTYRVVRRDGTFQQMCKVIDRFPNDSGIIYCISRKEVDTLSEQLRSMGYSAKPYHAGLSDEERQTHQEEFIRDKTRIIVATIAFGMGIDKPNVRYVLHSGVSKTVENYQQETGRAGRDGLPSECHLFFGGGDFQMWERICSDQPAEVKAVSEQALAAMKMFCMGTSCRHQALVRHFGQELKDPCDDACDICLQEVEFVGDPVKYAQMILSSIFRQGQNYGAAYTTDVLKGKKNARVVERKHDQLTTFGLLKTVTQKDIRNWIDQLIQQGFIVSDGEYHVLKITDDGAALLKGDKTCQLTKPVKATAGETGTATKKTSASLTDEEQGLFEELRTVRRGLAQERDVPPYVIFGDTSLVDMALQRPTSLERFLSVSGVGRVKCNDFGETFTSAIGQYCKEHGLDTDLAPAKEMPPARENKPPSASAMKAFADFDNGASVDDVMKKYARAQSTVYGYLKDYIHANKITDPTRWVSKADTERINDAIEELQPDRLKPIFDHLEQEVDYDTIRVVLECYQMREQE